MIDWNEIDTESEADWIKLGEQLIQRGMDALREPDDNVVKEILKDMQAFSEKPSLFRPASVMAAVGKVRAQVRQHRVDEILKDLADRSSELDAIVSSMKLSAAELKLEAERLRLKPLQEALALASQVVAQVKSVEAEVKNLPKDDIVGRLTKIGKAAEKLVDQLTKSVAA